MFIFVFLSETTCWKSEERMNYHLKEVIPSLIFRVHCKAEKAKLIFIGSRKKLKKLGFYGYLFWNLPSFEGVLKGQLPLQPLHLSLRSGDQTLRCKKMEFFAKSVKTNNNFNRPNLMIRIRDEYLEQIGCH